MEGVPNHPILRGLSQQCDLLDPNKKKRHLTSALFPYPPLPQPKNGGEKKRAPQQSTDDSGFANRW